MRVLLDEQLPRQRARHLVGHDVRTVQQQSWAGLKNGALLEAAEAAGFSVLVTGDQSLEHQQNLTKRTLAVDVVEVRDGNPGVSLHLDLIDGRISVGDGQIDAWNGVPQAGDDPDTPSSFDHWTITRPGGRWRVNSQRDDHPPSGQL